MKKIIFVSRLDSDCSLGASLLCKIALPLSQKYPDLQIIIIGGGTEYENTYQAAVKVNKIINRKLIQMIGETDDPSIYFDKNALFVGVSRAALEAMAIGTPVILLGNEGYLGLLDESKLELAIKTNFTCRGAREFENVHEIAYKLFADICRYFELPKEEKEFLSEFSRKIIQKEYNSKLMAQKTIDLYKQTISNYNEKIKKISICGYYGHGNLGDEAIHCAILQIISEKYPAADIRTLNSKNPLHILNNLANADLFIFGGGSLLQNSTSSASLLYYLAIIQAARALCKRTVMLANGFGPIKCRKAFRPFLYKIITETVDTFDKISVRDKESQAALKELLPKRSIEIVPDPTLFLMQTSTANMTIPKNEEYFIYIPCSLGLNQSKIRPEHVSISLSKIQKRFNLDPKIVVLNEKEDLYTANIIAKELNKTEVLCPKNYQELCKNLIKARFVISQRYHGTLFSNVCGISTVAISNDPKMKALCKDFSTLPCQNNKIFLTPNELIDAVALALDHHKEHRDTISQNILTQSSFCKQKIENAIK